MKAKGICLIGRAVPGDEGVKCNRVTQENQLSLKVTMKPDSYADSDIGTLN